MRGFTIENSSIFRWKIWLVYRDIQQRVTELKQEIKLHKRRNKGITLWEHEKEIGT